MQSSDPDQRPKVIVHSKKRVFDGFFKIDEIVYSHRQFDGEMSENKKRLVCNRGDSVGVLIYNQDLNRVILVEEFKVPTMDKGRSEGWIVETMAGGIRENETGLEAAKREAIEETGYALRNPELIGSFFSSPGGLSERIFLYFAIVRNSDRVSEGGGVRSEGEDVRVVELYPEELYARLEKMEIEDPKLLIATQFMRQRIRLGLPAHSPLPAETIVYRNQTNAKQIIGIKTGDIKEVRDVDVWVNSENTDMMMDRVIGKTISGNIRYLGAEKDDQGNVYEDTIADALRGKLGRRTFVKLGTLVETETGALVERGVRRVIHIASVEGRGPGQGVFADADKIGDCTAKVLQHVHKRNRSFLMRRSRFRSILIPLMGAGDGGLRPDQVALPILREVARFLKQNPKSELREIYLLALTARDRAAIDKAIREIGGFAIDDTAAEGTTE